MQTNSINQYIDRDEIRQKKVRLEEIKAELKQELFGLDDTIDKVVDSIKTWYLLPEVITHPIIINLFGLTGTGKTQLVRSLTRKLNFQSKFVEIQMDGISGGSAFKTSAICNILQNSSIDEGERGIILLDEFQRFRTLDEQGHEMKVERYQDVWQLLSDGKFSIDCSILEEIEQALAMTAFNKDYEESGEGDDDDDDEDDIPESDKPRKKPKVCKVRKYGIYPWEAKQLKKLFKLKETVLEIMAFKREKIDELRREFIADNKVDFIDYSKCLIFVCGNLDEAFRMSTDVEDSDTDADIFHQYSKKISVMDIKASLCRRFKPEQIARLGNNIIVYPSISKKSYQLIIESCCKKYITKATEVSGINFFIGDRVYSEIYHNSVYPAQGTRPVFSSIHQIFAAPLSEAVLWAFENNYNDVALDLDAEKSALIVINGSNSKELHVELDVQKQKKTNSMNFNSMVSVHEAGHAVVYALLYKNSPQEIAINLASFKGGYITRSDKALSTRSEILKSIKVSLAGTCAEEMVFGRKNISNGCSSDIKKATEEAGRYVRQLGFHDTVGLVTDSNERLFVENDFEPSNAIIEKLLQDCREDTMKLLEENTDFLRETFTAILKNSKVSKEEYIEIAKKYIPDLDPRDQDEYQEYHMLLEKF